MKYLFDEHGKNRIFLVFGFSALVLIIVVGGIVWYLQANRQENKDVPTPTQESENSGESQEAAGIERGVKFTFSSLPALPQGHYEAWLLDKDDTAYSFGKFRLDSKGGMMNMDGGSIAKGVLPLQKDVSEEQLQTMEGVQVSVEQDDDADTKMSGILILEGDISSKKASLAFIAVRLSNASAKYILATPTNDPEAFETSGIWFAIPSLRKEAPSLVLPRVPDGWKYEGWVLYKGANLSTGRFVQPRGIDEFSGYSGGANAGPAFPGEDFLRNAPEGLAFQFPIDLSDGESHVFISLEPDIQGNDPTGDAPFFLQPFTAGIPKGAKDHEVLNLNKDISGFPTGIAEIL